jgi:hypothetical protein
MNQQTCCEVNVTAVDKVIAQFICALRFALLRMQNKHHTAAEKLSACLLMNLFDICYAFF